MCSPCRHRIEGLIHGRWWSFVQVVLGDRGVDLRVFAGSEACLSGVGEATLCVAFNEGIER